MSTQLLDEIQQFLQELEPTQDEFLTLFGQKRIAVTRADTDAMLRLADSEAKLTEQMRLHLDRRRRILQQANQKGLPSDSIQALVGELGDSSQEPLKQGIERSLAKSESIRRESWVHWIVAQRGLNHCTELLDLIAYCGAKAPTYSRGPDQQTSGGAILDASI